MTSRISLPFLFSTVLVFVGCDSGSNGESRPTADASGDASEADTSTTPEVGYDAPQGVRDVSESHDADTLDGDTLDEDPDSADSGPDDALVSDVRDADGACVEYAEPVESGRMPQDVYETSGIVRSRLHDDLYWIHGDSGQDPIVRGINGTGEILAVLRIVDAEGEPWPMHDWEDITIGPCSQAGDSCVYVGAVGDNSSGRDHVEILRFPEPTTLTETDIVPEMMVVRYETGPRDVEALIIGEDLTLHLITKRPGAPHVLSVAWSSDGEDHLAADRGILEFPPLPVPGPYLITGADFDAGFGRVLLRTYVNVFECEVDSLDPGRIEAWECREVPQMLEFGGEAIAWADNGGYIHVSEGAGTAISRVDCAGL